MAKFMMAINEEDNTISNMSKTLTINKSETVVLALNLLNYVLEQRRAGKYLKVIEGAEDKTKTILDEATAGSVAFKLND